MSFVALATDRFDEVTHFYGERLGFPIVEQWDRAHGRGRRFDLGGMRLEILDNQRERQPLKLGDVTDKVHVVVEVDDIEATFKRFEELDAGVKYPPTKKPWGAVLAALFDLDGNVFGLSQRGTNPG